MRITSKLLKDFAISLAEALDTHLELWHDCYGYHLQEHSKCGGSVASTLNVGGLPATAMYYYLCGINNLITRKTQIDGK